MDFNVVSQFFGILIILPLIIFLIYITLKYSGKYMGKLSSGNIVKIIERVPLSQNTFLTVVMIDNKLYVLSNGEKGVQILMELDKEAIDKYKPKEDIKSFNTLNAIITNKFRRKDKE